MKYIAKDVQDYLSQMPDDRKVAMNKLRDVILNNLPSGFEETILYDMISYVVPHSIYPAGYHVYPSLPLSFISLASQKNNISLYHSGLYVFPDLLAWFESEYALRVKTKLDMGKSCIRFKNMNAIPYDLIGELCQKISVSDYVEQVEKGLALRK